MIQTSEGSAYLGDFHVHSSLSDGHVEPLEMARAAEAKDFDFLSIADHDHCAELEVGLNEQLHRLGSNLLVLSAEEVSLVAGLGDGVVDDHIGHLLALGIRQEVHRAIGEIGNVSHLERAKIICDQIHQQDGLAILAHPFWQPTTLNPNWSVGYYHCDPVVSFGLLESGKSTLLKVVDGILTPQEGEVLLKDRPVSGYTRSDVAKEVAMVAQETHFYFSFSALEVVLMGRFPRLGRFQFEGTRDMEAASRALQATQCLDLAERSIHELSGGEKQRVLIARALAQEPTVILLDEPTSFLDLRYKKEIFDLISSLTHEKGLSVVVVSHDSDLASQYCDRMVMLKDGRVYSTGVPEEVITASNIKAVYECPVIVDKNPAAGSPRVSLV